MAAPLSLSGYRPFFGLERARAKLAAVRDARSTSVRDASETTPPAPFRPGLYREIEVDYDPGEGTAWCWMNPREAPSFTPGMLDELRRHCRSMREAAERAPTPAQGPIKHSVLASRLPGIFNLGGDLERFTAMIRAGDRTGLTAYARACIDVSHDNSTGFGEQAITISLVQGDALGGGLESALSSHVVVAERGVKFGLPEILFNLFPGMGAYSLLARKVGAAMAERIITSGKIYTAEEFHDLGLVTVLAEPGDGVAEVNRLIQRNLRRHNGLLAIQRAARRVMPLDYDELRDVTEYWIDAALNLTESDMRKMERLASAQDRKVAAAGSAGAA